ncbi:MAG: helicase-related protein [Acetobacteraceae bacterium]|nr:helicase-related protein [Acetobacteraceae bacterium]
MTEALNQASVAARLMSLARARQDLPATLTDADSVAASASPDAGTDELVAALQGAIADRLAPVARRNPDIAFAEAAERSEELSGRPPGVPALQALATLVARAAGLDPADANQLRQRLVAAEQSRRAAAAAAKERARALEQSEQQRRREWESELVGAEALPALLGVPRRLVDRWLAEGLIPVARTTTTRQNGQIVEELDFHPEQIAALLPQVARWKGLEPDAQRKVRVPNGAIARRAGLDRFAAHFAEARALDRRITLVVGPTNSGKSHYALDRLAAAESGVALAPLRLLALEFQDALAARGVPASLITGEERHIVPGAQHVACTVEMANTGRIVDVAIVDEAQMLADPDRGASWTAAIMGIPAREVIVLGAPDCQPLVQRLAELCDEPMEVVRLERKSPLRVADESVGIGAIGPGDAIVAFSRREVFAMREQVVARGLTPAVIYGALGPEVRRAESRRFRENEAPVLVATDAIGMGLNLPIRRVLFSSLMKWDGREDRSLTPAEVRQIGGRAGRYGQHEEGVVAVLSGGGEPRRLRALMGTEPAAPADLRPLVSPDRRIVQGVAEELGTQSLLETLRRISKAVLRPGDPNYRLADLEQQMEIAAAIDGTGLSLLDRWTYALCPVDLRDAGIERLLRWGVDHAAGVQIAPPSVGHLPPPERADQTALERAEKVAKRLVSWRWLAQHYPETYAETDRANEERRRLDTFIEMVLRQQAIGRARRFQRGGGKPREPRDPAPTPAPSSRKRSGGTRRS